MIAPKTAKPTPREEREAYDTAEKRANGICEGCGILPATDMHHRLYRSRGGLTTADNLLHLCGGKSGMKGGNHSGCHGQAHTLIGEQRGWSVKSRKNPAEIPVWHIATGSWTLAGEPCNPADAVELLILAGQIKTGMVG